ncbi:Trp biosynthesis-associated membrane protein [Phytohabitans aurantiacus]|jgi:hypothetical protein|uniref:Trp biosynthesis protein n=1 Tax=Phytohabitans aurantiacus TaxID=3016789 RepID=A0ABQ5R5N5_9ACTN|nr:Trp biosynthesis-associated membrane protein [Phytohabitans aurantiacus]GLI01197.1 hypothetical protein Pa4123_64730 [Phytohabitans aurantiacus]
MNARREISIAVVLSAAGAGLALFAATRTWWVEVVPRPAPLPATRTPHDGGGLLPALALVGLAGAGALVATKGRARRWLGVLLLLNGAGVATSGALGLADATGWPLACVAGGVLLAAGGALAVVRGGGWPSLGTRYERAPVVTSDWDALDRGEDPTLR